MTQPPGMHGAAERLGGAPVCHPLPWQIYKPTRLRLRLRLGCTMPRQLASLGSGCVGLSWKSGALRASVSQLSPGQERKEQLGQEGGEVFGSFRGRELTPGSMLMLELVIVPPVETGLERAARSCPQSHLYSK